MDKNAKTTDMKQPVWVSDDLAKECAVCKKEFGLFRGKHHCRYWYVRSFPPFLAFRLRPFATDFEVCKRLICVHCVCVCVCVCDGTAPARSGNVICDACSGERMILGPKKPDSVPQRVCDTCVRELKKTQEETTQNMTGICLCGVVWCGLHTAGFNSCVCFDTFVVCSADAVSHRSQKR